MRALVAAPHLQCHRNAFAGRNIAAIKSNDARLFAEARQHCSTGATGPCAQVRPPCLKSPDVRRAVNPDAGIGERLVRVDEWRRYRELEESDTALALLKSMLDFEPSQRPTPVRMTAT